MGQILRLWYGRGEAEMAAFAEKLRAVREKLGLSQYAVAKQTGISKQALSLLELGEREPSWDTVQKLALVLGVECTAFMDEGLSLPEIEPSRGPGRPPKEKPHGTGASKGRKKT
jgi:transcriptional regulator with XRE-family HTH domain